MLHWHQCHFVNPHIQVLLTVLHVMTCLKVTKQCDHFHTFTTTLVILDVSAEEVSHTHNYDAIDQSHDRFSYMYALRDPKLG